MTLTSLVCSLELSKKLKELGVKQESFFVWDYRPGNSSSNKWEVTYQPLEILPHASAAFTAGELWKMASPVRFIYGIRAEFFKKCSLENYLAAVLIGLIENGDIPVEDVNLRMNG